MENHEEKQSVEEKITTFASPAVLAAILGEDGADGMVDEQESERIDESLDSSLNDSLESTKLRELGDLDRLNASDESHKPLEFISEQVSNFPQSSTPLQTGDESNDRKIDKPPKPRRPQHIIERNKERIGKRTPAKTSYAQMHAIKARNRLEKMEDKFIKKTGEKSPDNTAGSSLGNQSEHLEETLDQNSYFQGHVGQIHHDMGPVNEQESDLLQDNSYLNGSFNTYHNPHHGPYYDVSQNSSLNYNESSYLYQPASYGRGYQSAMANLRQSHAMARPVPPLHYNPLSTQSAPPGVYGYHRKPLISNIRSLHEEDYNLSSALPNTDFVHSDRGNKIPESSLHRKFSSEPYLVQSNSPSLQKMTNVGRNSKASGSYSSLRQPFQYKPYTLKEYRNFAGAEGEHLAGGLGPNVDTDDFKEKMKNVSKQREYAAMLRSRHSTMKKQQERKASTQLLVKPQHIKDAEIKRQAALNYAKNVPKPKQMLNRKRGSPGSGQYGRDPRTDDNQDITVLEILRMRHEKEKQEVDTIRKDLASKIRL